MSAEEPTTAPATAPLATTEYEQLDFDQKMRIYYDRVFPYDVMYQWLSYGNSGKDSSVSEAFCRREFSFTLKDDIYIRYLSYPSAEAWKQDMVKKIPHKIDMGAVYTAEPKQKTFLSKEAFKEVSREFVLDIDLTDYQEDGTIKSDCIDPSNPEFKKSWKFMAIAVKILDRALRQDFGFKHLLWVFSGRRGIHCWVADERARYMSNQARSAVADYLNIFKGGEGEKTKLSALNGQHLHPSLERAYATLQGLDEDTDRDLSFESLLVEQEWLEPPQLDKFLDMMGDEDLKEEILEKLNRGKKSATQMEKWEVVLGKIEKPMNEETRKKRGKKGTPTAQDILMHLHFKLLYPRLDINVSKMMNHLLKSPFCVHPKTHRICIPIDPEKLDKFDPTEVPSLEDALRDLDTKAASNAKQGYTNSLLDDHILTFRNSFLKPLVAESMAKRRQDNDSTMQF